MAYLSYHNSSLGVQENTSSTYGKCTLCNKKATVFYCQDCIRNGDFYRSCMRVPERYADKKLRDTKHKNWMDRWEGEIIKIFEKKKRKERIVELIRSKQDQITRIRKTIYSTSRKFQQVSEENHYYEECVKVLRSNEPLRISDLEEMRKKLKSSENENNLLASKLREIEMRNKTLTKKLIANLTEYIFPLTKIEPRVPHSQESMDDEMVMAIAEAANTHFERGRWVTEAEKGGAVKIVEQYLPSCGNYDNDDMARNDLVSKRGPENISAGLAHLCQLVNVISTYIGAYLPKNVKCNDFNDLIKFDESDDFKQAVCKLNANVVHLCVSQGVPQELIKPLQTAENVLLLLKKGDLGRQGSFEFSHILLKKLDNCATMYFEVDVDDDYEYMLPPDWEALPPLPPLNTDTYYSPSRPSSSYFGLVSEAPSIVSSAAASVISLWKGYSHRQK